MPLARYFLYVGSAPSEIAGRRPGKFSLDHSFTFIPTQKWPERIVYETSLQTAVSRADRKHRSQYRCPEIVASAPGREAFAQLQPSRQLSDAKSARTDAGNANAKIAKRRAAPPALLGSVASAVWAGLATAFGERLDESYNCCGLEGSSTFLDVLFTSGPSRRTSD